MTVKFKMDGNLAIATFADGPMNLLTMDSFYGLMEAVDQAIEHKARAFLTIAEGDHFCAGAHIVENFLGQDANYARRMLSGAIPEMHRFENLPFPTVVAVRGMCLGGGCEILQLHDIAYASETSNFGQVEARIGTTTLLGGAQRLVARVGLQRAKEMVLTAGIYDAKTMLDWGLLNKVYPEDSVEEKAYKFAKKLSEGPTVAYAASKHMINATVSHGMGAADLRLADAAAGTFATQDMVGSVNRFAKEGADILIKGLLEFKGE